MNSCSCILCVFKKDGGSISLPPSLIQRQPKKYIYKEREKNMATVARGGMVVIKKLGWDLLVSLSKSVGV